MQWVRKALREKKNETEIGKIIHTVGYPGPSHTPPPPTHRFLEKDILYKDLWRGTPFFLAWLSADRNLIKGGLARLIWGSRKVVVLYWIEFSCCLMEQGRSRAFLYRSCHLRVSFLKVHKNENFFGFDFEICTFS